MKSIIDGDTLKRFQNALRGARLSGTAAHQINQALCSGRPYKHLCNQDEKLPGIWKQQLQEIVDEAIASGVTPSASLLTPHQQKALRKGTAR